MKPPQVLQEIRKNKSRRSSRRMERETANASGLDRLIDRRLEQTSNRQAPANEVIAMPAEYRRQHMGWNVKHFHNWYHRTSGTRSYTEVKKHLQKSGARFQDRETWRAPKAS